MSSQSPDDERGFSVHDRRWWTDEAPRAEAPPESKPTYVEQLERQLADHRQRLAEAQQKVRAAADETSVEIARARERLEREAERDKARARADLLRGFLDVVDDIDRALAAAPAADPLREGLELIQRRFLARLADHGVQRLDPLGQPFDPRLHEALATVPVPADQAGRVAHVVAPGYTLGDTILRPAHVTVGRAIS
ncbi:MAG TPA: nucleotide exchange factor GrpE [Kofleriaceae bacterium]|nr:nucleotide exchange factor GrpE [Kofleriaceae bacterium]